MKQMKVLTVFAALAMTLGLSACGGKKECKTHQWGSWETTKAATCQETGSEKRVCKKCGKEQTRSVDKLEHQWQEVAGTKVEATCEEAGHYSRKCSLCQTQQDNVEIPALGHDWVDDEDQTAAVAPTCTTAGTKLQHCSHDASHTRTDTVAALGHDWGEWEETKAPKCEEDGERKHTCQRAGCGVEEKEVVAKLGHHLVQQADDGTSPKEDFAKVRVFACDRDGCDYATFGFSANEASSNSGRLVSETVTNEKGEEEVGKRFWGRPIGNDVALDENGTADRDNHEPVYNPETQGDLFEYKFTLTEAQVQALGSDIACYADAKPADYLNNKDFWAADSGEEWTPGFYIEGDKAGTQITDYRYILYVDGQPVEFDPTITAPLPASPSTNLARGQFIMPYIFHFTAGDHSISLRMAGGYRSIFFNFIFKSYEAPEVPPEPPVEDPWVLDETTVMPQGENDALVKRYTNSKETAKIKYEIDVATAKMALDSGAWKNNPTSGKMKLNGDGDACHFTFGLPEGFEGKMYQRAYMDGLGNPGSTSGNAGKKAYYEKGVANIEVKINNGDPIDFSDRQETTFTDLFGDERNGSDSVVKDIELGNVVLRTANTISYKRVKTLNMIVSSFVFIGEVHTDVFVADGEKDGVVNPEKCACGQKAYRIDMADADAAGWHDPNTKWNAKSGATTTATWDITGKIPAGNYKIAVNVKMTSSSHTNRYWYNQYATDSGQNADKESEDPFRYFFKLDGVTVNPDTTLTWGEQKLSNTAYNYAEIVSSITITAESASFQMVHGNIGYSLFVSNVRLIAL